MLSGRLCGLSTFEQRHVFPSGPRCRRAFELWWGDSTEDSLTATDNDKCLFTVGLLQLKQRGGPLGWGCHGVAAEVEEQVSAKNLLGIGALCNLIETCNLQVPLHCNGHQSKRGGKHSLMTGRRGCDQVHFSSYLLLKTRVLAVPHLMMAI